MESCLPPTPDVVVGPGGPVPGLGLAQRAGPQAVSPTAGQARGGGGPLHSHPQCCARPCTRATGPPAASSQSLGVSAPPPGAGPVLRPCGPATRGGSCSVTLGLDTLGFRQGRADFLMRALLEGKAAAGPVARVPSRQRGGTGGRCVRSTLARPGGLRSPSLAQGASLGSSHPPPSQPGSPVGSLELRRPSPPTPASPCRAPPASLSRGGLGAAPQGGGGDKTEQLRNPPGPTRPTPGLLICLLACRNQPLAGCRVEQRDGADSRQARGVRAVRAVRAVQRVWFSGEGLLREEQPSWGLPPRDGWPQPPARSPGPSWAPGQWGLCRPRAGVGLGPVSQSPVTSGASWASVSSSARCGKQEGGGGLKEEVWVFRGGCVAGRMGAPEAPVSPPQRTQPCSGVR